MCGSWGAGRGMDSSTVRRLESTWPGRCWAELCRSRDFHWRARKHFRSERFIRSDRVAASRSLGLDGVPAAGLPRSILAHSTKDTRRARLKINETYLNGLRLCRVTP